MFRLIRTAILVFVAFAAGVLYERGAARSLCAAGDGQWTNGICLGSDLQ